MTDESSGDGDRKEGDNNSKEIILSNVVTNMKT